MDGDALAAKYGGKKLSPDELAAQFGGTPQKKPVKPFKLPEMAGGEEFKQGLVGAGSAALDDLSNIGSGIKSFWQKPLGEKAVDVLFSPYTIGTGAVEGVGRTATQAESEVRNPSLTPIQKTGGVVSALAGGDPEEARRQEAAGDPGGAFYSAVGRPALTAVAGEAASRVVGPIIGPVERRLPGLYTEDVGPELVSKEAKSSLKSLLGSDLPKQAGERLDAPGGVIDRMTPYLRMAAKNLGYDDKTVDAALAGKEYEISHPIRSIKDRNKLEYRVSKGVDVRRTIFDEAEKIFGRQFDTLMREYSGQSISPQRMGQLISSNIDRYTEFAAPRMANRLREIGLEAGQSDFKTIGEWDKLRKKYNALADQAFTAMQAGQTGYDMETVDAYRRTVDAIRDAEYEQLGLLAALPKDQIESLQRLHRDAVQMKMANEDVTQRAEAAQAEHQNSLTGRVVAGRSGERSPSVRRGIVSALLPGPQGEQNIAFRKALRGVGEAGTPDRILPEMREQWQLPQPGPEPVEVPTEVSRVIQQAARSGQTARPLETQAVVTRRHLPPIADERLPSHYAGQPTDVRPDIAPADERTPSFYASQANRPYRTDVTSRVGQYAEPGELPASTITGQNAGTITVSTPEDAQKMLDSLKSSNFSGLDSATRAKVEETIESLQKLASHKTLPTGPAARRMRVLPGQPGRHVTRTAKKWPTKLAGQIVARDLPPLQDRQQ